MRCMDALFPRRQGEDETKNAARRNIALVSLFIGDVRDGLTMINMQSAFLISSKHYTERQAGVLFFVFGMSQFIFQAPAGYLFDYSDQKLTWLAVASVVTTALSVLSTAFAAPKGENISLIIFLRALQGAATSFIPTGLNCITQGIVGASGMTEQVAVNEALSHAGTVVIALVSSLLAVALYPNLGLLFIVGPIFLIGVLYYLYKINPDEIDYNEARGLTTVQHTKTFDCNDAHVLTTGQHTKPTVQEYIPPWSGSSDSSADDQKISLELARINFRAHENLQPFDKHPSFNFGFMDGTACNVLNPFDEGQTILQANSPLRILCDPVLLLFLVIMFTFHLTNTTMLPLIMQTLAVGSGGGGMMLAGMCMVVSQTVMAIASQLCGTYSASCGRKPLFLIGLFALPVRCWLLSLLLEIRGANDENPQFSILDCLIISTQMLAGISLGIVGTMYILVTSDIAGGTGRFSMTLGLTTGAIAIGSTVSGYVGEALVQDLGYQTVFARLSILALVPALLYALVMPETISPAMLQEKKLASIDEEDTEAVDNNETSASKGLSTNYGVLH